MKISYSWLKNYLDLKERPEKVAEALTMGIAEVERIEELGKGLEKIVVGEVLEVKKHPNADKLSLTKVKVGSGKILQIICGAKNVAVGQKVPVARVGTVLPKGIKIEAREIRRIKSYGMICSEVELGLGKEAEGIMVLDPRAKIGESLKKHLGYDDFVLEIDNKSLTHRSDLFCHIGIARELAAILGKKLKLPKLKKPKESRLKKLNVKVQSFADCPRYMDVVLDNVKIRPAPFWMQSYLKAVGVRPINNVVDITNFLMLEYGHPTHAFDYDKVQDQAFHVRKAKRGERIVTIDEIKRDLNESMIIIEDSKRIIDLAGIMGGAVSEIDEKTKSIVLEAANFDKVLIRKTAQKLGLRTEAVIRYEKGLSSDLTRQVLWRGVELLEKYAGAKVASKIYDLKRKLPREKKIKFDLDYLNKLSGADIPRQRAIKILKSLEFKISSGKDILDVAVPLFRTDVNLPEDLVEEVTRLYGYGKIRPLPLVSSLYPVLEKKDLFWAKKVNCHLANWGFYEAYNYSFYGERLLAKCKLSKSGHVELKNPLSPDLSLLRVSLLPRLLENLEKNSRRHNQIKLFEIGHIFMPGCASSARHEASLAGCESKMLTAVICGAGKDAFYQAKGTVELLFKKLNIPCQFEILKKQASEYWNPYKDGRSLRIQSEGKYLGTISEVDGEVLENFDLSKKHIAFFDLFFEEIAKLAGRPQKFQSLPKYPASTLDLAFVLDKKIQAAEIQKTILEAGKPLLANLELFDVYEGKPLLFSEKNLAFHLIYQAEDRTLKDEEVKTVQEKIVRVLEKKFGAKVRKF